MSRFQPENNNLANPNRFQLFIQQLPDVSFFAKEVPIPGVSVSATSLTTHTNVTLPVPGDTLEYEDLPVDFFVDEDYANWISVHKWLIANTKKTGFIFSDIAIISLTNNFNPNVKFQFVNAFPDSLSGVNLTTASGADSPLTARVNFKYSYYDILPVSS